MVERLDRAPGRGGIVGVNIGANRDSEDRISDYVAGVRLFAPIASYLTINISSPNTPGLRDLQSGEQLPELLRARRRGARGGGGGMRPAHAAAPEDRARPRRPRARRLIEIVRARSGIDGLIVSNTTVARPRAQIDSGTRRSWAGFPAGRSSSVSTAMLARARQLAGPDLVLVGVGGVDGAAAAWSKIAAGADLVQLYTGLIYEGPSLPRRIAAELLKRLEERNIKRIADVRGIETERWAAAWSRPDAASERYGCVGKCARQEAPHAPVEGDAARAEEDQQRRPQAVIAEGRRQHRPGGEIDEHRQQHHVAHVARPGRADEDAVHLEGDHAGERRQRRPDEIAPRRLAHLRRRRHQVDERWAEREIERG